MKKFLFEGKRKLISIPIIIVLVISFWPFLLGALLVYFAVKKIHLKGLKYTFISLVLFFSLIFGSAWVAAMKSPTPSSENTTTSVAGVTTIAETATPTQRPSNTPTQTQATKVSPIATPIPTQAPTPTKTVPTPTKYVIPTATPTIYIPPTSTPVSQNNGGYACDCSKTCTQISSCAEAQYQLNVCGCSRRDGDGDGIACDSAPLHCQN